MTLPPTIAWRGGVDGHLELLDQTQLPAREVVLPIHGIDDAIAAIRRLSVRGAPAIGVAAAYALVLGVRRNAAAAADLSATVREVASRLLAARPTAVNLRWALDRCIARAACEPALEALFEEAVAIHEHEVSMSKGIAEHGRRLVPEGGTVITHCNTGRLATAGDGTALAVLFAAWRAGTRFRVLADETRPLLQGTRLTALELSREGIPVDVVADGAAAGLIARGQVQMAIVGADRIARNGDFANKVGTYPLALACKANGVPFYVAAPASTFDLDCADGAAIPIEERDGTEVTEFAGRRIAPPGVGARNPAFDVTGASLVTAFVTDRGLLEPPFAAAIKEMLAHGR
jgi:methylthioribose-1-phosphate isomerase